MNASWFSPLQPAAGRPWTADLAARPIQPRADTKTGALLQYLHDQAPKAVPTLTLCHVVDVESRLIWGLLKNARASGLVRYEQGRWHINPDHDDALADQIRQAAAMLRRHGWTVAAPSPAHPEKGTAA